MNSAPSSVPSTGVSGRAPAHSRCRGVRLFASTVTTPTRRPGGSSRSTHGTCRSDDVATGTPHSFASRSWYSTRNPQLAAMPSAPSAASSCPAATKSSTTPPRSRTTRSGVAPGDDAPEHRKRPRRRRSRHRPGCAEIGSPAEASPRSPRRPPCRHAPWSPLRPPRPAVRPGHCCVLLGRPCALVTAAPSSADHASWSPLRPPRPAVRRGHRCVLLGRPCAAVIAPPSPDRHSIRSSPTLRADTR